MSSSFFTTVFFRNILLFKISLISLYLLQSVNYCFHESVSNTLDLSLLSKFSFCSQKLYDYLNAVFNLVANFIFTYLLLYPWLYRKYKPIESYEQRCRYKQDFQTQYREYIELKKIVDSVSRKFLELDQVRRKYPEDSEKGQVIFTFLITFD